MAVDHPRSKQEAKNLIEAGHYYVGVSCHSLSQHSAEELIESFRTHNLGKCIIYITKTPWDRPRIKAEVFISGIDGPERLIEAVRTCEVAA